MIAPSWEERHLARIWAALQQRGQVPEREILDQVAAVVAEYFADMDPLCRSSCDTCGAQMGSGCHDGRQPLDVPHPGRGERLERPQAILEWMSRPQRVGWFDAQP